MSPHTTATLTNNTMNSYNTNETMNALFSNTLVTNNTTTICPSNHFSDSSNNEFQELTLPSPSTTLLTLTLDAAVAHQGDISNTSEPSFLRFVDVDSPLFPNLHCAETSQQTPLSKVRRARSSPPGAPKRISKKTVRTNVDFSRITRRLVF